MKNNPRMSLEKKMKQIKPGEDIDVHAQEHDKTYPEMKERKRKRNGDGPRKDEQV